MTPREAELTAALAASQQQVVELKQENEILRLKIDALVRRIFGVKSEKIDPAQLELFMAGVGTAGAPLASGEATSAAAGTATGDTLDSIPPEHPVTPAPKSARRPRLPEHLPIIEEPERSADRLSRGQPRRGERQRIKSLILTPSPPTPPATATLVRKPPNNSTSCAATSSAATLSGANM